MANEITSLTSNKSIDYLSKDFDSVSDALISFATVNYGPGTSRNRLWSNFNVDSFSRSWLELVAYVADLLLFYQDVQATESYLQTARIRSNVKNIAAQFGFVPATASSASVDVVFTTTSSGTIPRGFKLMSTSGVPFYLTSPVVAGIAGQYTGTALQGEIKSETFVSQGLQNEEFNLIGPNIIRDLDNINLADITPYVEISGNEYTLVESFVRFNGTDSPVVEDSLGNVVGGGGRVFTLHERADGTPFIRFGDGIFGRKLVSGEVITINYRTGGGSQGNIAASTITLQDSLPFVSSVINPEPASGGADEQSIEQLRQLIPASLRILNRAVSETDYSDLIVTNFSEVFAASTEANTTDPGIDLNIYVVPQGAGISNITNNTLLLTQINNFVDRRKTVTVQFQILDAYSIDALVTLEVFLNDTASKTTVRRAIQTAMENFFSLTTGGSDEAGIGFAEQILLKDVYEVIKAIDGVSRFEIKRLSYRPRVAKNVQGLVTDYKHNDVTIFPKVSEAEWLLAASGEVQEVEDVVIFDNSKLEGFSYDSNTGEITYDFPVDLSGVGPGDKFRNGPGQEEQIEIKTVGDGVGEYEVVKVTTLADQQGTKEETTITARADVAGDLGGTYFVIYDIAGPVGVWFNVASGNTQPSTGANRHIEVSIATNDTADDVATALQTALDADSEFTATVLTNVVTVTHDNEMDVADTADGSVPTSFTINTTVLGTNPDSLAGAYFDIEDSSGPVRIWFDIDNTSTAPSVPMGGRLLEVDISANDPANDVASALQTVVDGDSEYSATVIGNQVTITNVAVGPRANPTDGLVPTSFTFTVVTQGAAAVTIGGKYFDLYDTVGAVRVWFDRGADVAPATPSGGRLLPVVITTGDNANTVASLLRTVLDGDSKFSAPAPVGNVVIVTSSDKTILTDANEGDSGFTLTTLIQGCDDDTDFYIFSVDNENSSLFILPNQPVNEVAGVNAGGSIRNGDTAFQAFKCFKKINSTATNLSVDSITDSSIDLSIISGTGVALNANILIDNSQVFVPEEYADGNYYLVDGAGNIWEIVDNNSNTITTSITAVNDASVTVVSGGSYKIVKKLIGSQIVFNGSIFNIQYNSHNTIYSIGAQFTQIGTIGDSFQISDLQSNIGNIGVSVDLISFNQSNKQARLNGSPDLEGISSANILMDASGQAFSIIAVDNRALPQIAYAESNTSSELILTGSGLGSQYSQGFKVTSTDSYAVVTLNLRREGNILGSLSARIVADDGTGLPDITSVVAVSNAINVTSVSELSERVVFSFSSPPTLVAGVQYHIVLSGDVSYNNLQQDSVLVYNNAAAYTYNSLSGIVQYSAVVNLASVVPGNFFQDNDGVLFPIIAVDDLNDSLTLDSGLPVVVGSNGHVYANDSIHIAIDDSSPTYSDGEVSRFDGSAWSNSTTGPNQLPSSYDAIFSVEGPKSIKIDSNLTPVLGTGATITSRYYDDENEISLALGISAGSITSATDVNAAGKGTVGSIPNTNTDQFTFRTSRIADDIINLRKMEIPQLDLNDLVINIYNGID